MISNIPSTATSTAYLTGLILEEQTELTLDEVCRACAAQAEMIVDLVNEGVLAPSGPAPGQWRFTGLHLHQARIAVRLQSDLGVNLAGVALALQLLDEVQALRAQLGRIAED